MAKKFEDVVDSGSTEPSIEQLEAQLAEKKAAAKAKADDEAAKAQAEHDEAHKDPLKWLVIEDVTGGRTVVEAPKDFFLDRRLLHNGLNHEHVSEDHLGRWVYRRM